MLSTTLRLSLQTELTRNEMKKKSFPGCTSQIPDFSPPGLPHRRRLPQLSLPRFPISIFIGVVSNNLLHAVRGDVQTENPFSFGHITGQFQLEIFSCPLKATLSFHSWYQSSSPEDQCPDPLHQIASPRSWRVLAGD